MVGIAMAVVPLLFHVLSLLIDDHHKEETGRVCVEKNRSEKSFKIKKVICLSESVSST